FYLLEKDRNLTLTEDLEIHIVELDKFIKKFDNLKTNLETWVYLLKESSNLKGEIVKSLEKKNPSIKKAISELKNISRSPKNRGLFDARKKAEMDHFSIISEIYDKAKSEVKEVAYKEGLEKGIEEGIQKGIQKGLEGIYLGIQLNLETRFQIQKSNPLIKEIHKIKDIELLKEILIQSVKAKNISELKKKLKFIKN
ncbi:MAG: PD-(D/E)XK nuclease family transposase, partial [Leptospiraceae bacterium]|nr:PD-(D/E)XK nuclease family transposase [Leptospiraceae bacterium]